LLPQSRSQHFLLTIYPSSLVSLPCYMLFRRTNFCHFCMISVPCTLIMILTYLNLKRIVVDTKQEIHTSSKRHEIEEIGAYTSVMWSLLLGHLISSQGRFTPRGQANSLCKRLEILTCDWPKGSHRLVVWFF
jgi:CHASE3 domain sensor protein